MDREVSGPKVDVTCTEQKVPAAQELLVRGTHGARCVYRKWDFTFTDRLFTTFEGGFFFFLLLLKML